MWLWLVLYLFLVTIGNHLESLIIISIINSIKVHVKGLSIAFSGLSQKIKFIVGIDAISSQIFQNNVLL